ncbi:pantothenate kinase 4-like, partial [Paramuricea clavata]
GLCGIYIGSHAFQPLRKDVLQLGRLPTLERTQLNLLKHTHRKYDHFPENLQQRLHDLLEAGLYMCFLHSLWRHATDISFNCDFKSILVDKEDEMQCLIKGCNFMLHNIPNEIFEFHRDQGPQYVFKNLLGSDLFPYLLVNIGSGVSILKVDSFDSFVRVGGTSMGGGTFWGLGSLLTSAKGFDELLDLAKGGQHTNVDMLVKDIYGGDYSLIGLPGDLTACTFGKAVRSAMSDSTTNVNRTKGFSEKDIAKSLLHMISNDIGQLASLHAKLYGLKRIIFGGFFIRGYPITMHTITFAINYWSKGGQKALFMRHEGYLGAIGAFIKGAEEEAAADGSLFYWNWGENYAGSSGLPTKTFKTPQLHADVK